MSSANWHTIFFYSIHAWFLVLLCGAYLFFFQPEQLDKTKWLWALLILVWSLYNSPLSSRLLGHTTVYDYRQVCLRHFAVFWKVSAIMTALSCVAFSFMFGELWARWSYVERLKSATLDNSGEAIPLADAEELAEAYNLYPHRREVAFIVGRMARLLAFDDQIRNYNAFIEKFLANISVPRILAKYANRQILADYEGSMDPIPYVARLRIDAESASAASLQGAIDLLRKYRQNDPLAELDILIFEHEMRQHSNQKVLKELRERIETILASAARQTSPRAQTHIVTAHVFQELLDHYAQIQIRLAQFATAADRADCILRIGQTYVRILTMRKHIVDASSVPWLDPAIKLSLYQYFKHRVGRETEVTREVMNIYSEVPGLQERLNKVLFEAEAFKEFRSLDTWDRGTPLSSAFAGKGMYNKIVEWLKSGW